jgi:tetratricopeptide (TPR) repeat protein
MHHLTLRLIFSVVCSLIVPLAPSLGQSTDQSQRLARDQDQKQNAQEQNQDLNLCSGETPSPDAGIEACSRLLDQEARESSRRRAIALTFRALAWKAKGEVKNAVTDLTEAIGLDEDFAPAYEARADLLRDNDQCDLALPEYDRVVKLAPERAPTYISRALCLSAKNQAQGASEDLDRAIKLDANNADGYAITALGIKARLDIEKGDFDSALKSYDASIAFDPKAPALYLDRGMAWGAKGDQEKALADFDQTIKLDTNNASGYAMSARALRARSYASSGNLEAAVAEYDEAVKLDPKQTTLYLDRAALWNLRGDNERALADYGEAIKIDPQNASSYVARADFRRGKGEYDQAVADYDQAVEKQPDDLTAYGNRALARFYAGAFAKATGDFKRVADAQANAYPALMLYVSRSRDGDAREAKNDLTKSAAKLKAGEWPYPIVELYLGKKSAKDTEAQAKTSGEKCEAQFYIGEWHLLRKDRSEAAKALQAAADSCPKDFVENRAAAEELKRLK